MERLVFNKEQHKFEELKEYGFVKRLEIGYNNDTNITYENIEWHFNVGDSGIEIHEQRKDNYWNYGFDIKEIHIWNDCERPVDKSVWLVLYDLIKDGLVVKENQDVKD